MTKLQNNFTTTEQSKRLFELGVPEDSADCYLLRTHTKGDTFVVEVLQDELYSKKDKFINLLEYLPCWSVGRLIEINRICSTLPDEEWMFPFWKDQEDNIEWAIRVMESGVRVGNMDFSKLDE